MIEKEYYDKTVIVSGDGDFYCLIEYLLNKEKLEKLMVPSRKYSSLLREFNDYIVDISFLRNVLEKKGTEIRGRSKP